MRTLRPNWITVTGLLALILSTATVEDYDSTSNLIEDVKGALLDVKTYVSRLDGCGLDQVGDECEAATALSAGSSGPTSDGTELLSRALNPDQKVAIAGRGQLIFGLQQTNLDPRALPTQGVASGEVETSRGPCRTRNGKFEYKNDRRKYFRCRGGLSFIKTCDKKHVFDPKRQYCVRSRKTATAASSGMQLESKTLRSGFGFPHPRSRQRGGRRHNIFAFLLDREENSPPTGFLASNAVRPIKRTSSFRDILDNYISRFTSDYLGRWSCMEMPVQGAWVKQHQTLGDCWSEALRRSSQYMAVSSSGCLFWKRRQTLNRTACSPATPYVMKVDFYKKDLAKLHPDMNGWISARPAIGVQWDTVPNVKSKPDSIRGCVQICYKFGQDFARVDSRGCRCGMATDWLAKIRHEDMDHLRSKKAAIDPGFTVELHAGGVRGWECTAAPSSFVPATGAQNIQQAMADCQRRKFRFLAPGKDNFFCGNSTDNLQRFSRTNCEMNVTTTNAYTVISINVIERQIRHTEDTLSGFVIWWVIEKAPDVFWTTLLGTRVLEQCVVDCNKRFVSIGPDGCSCGSLRTNRTSLHVQEWMSGISGQTMTPDKGYLLMDKEGFVNVPEGWHCTSEPSHWTLHPAKRFSQCIDACTKSNQAFAAFGKSGCRCGNRSSGFRALPIVHCQTELRGVDAYSVLSVRLWNQNYANYSSKAGYRVFWTSEKPSGVQWEVQPGLSVLEQCVSSCSDRIKVLLVMIGVDGCECGVLVGSGYSEWLDRSQGWTAPAAHGRGFFVIQQPTPSTGYRPPQFRWIVKDNITKISQKTTVKVQPAWIRLNISEANTVGLRRAAGASRVNTTFDYTTVLNGPAGRGVYRVQSDGSVYIYDNRTRSFREVNRSLDGATSKADILEKDSSNQEKTIATRRQENVNNTQRHYIRTRGNSISIASKKIRQSDLENESSDRRANQGYKKRTVKSFRDVVQTELFSHDKSDRQLRGATTLIDIVAKDVDVNQTHADSSAKQLRLQKVVMKRSKGHREASGFSLNLRIHIGGKCFLGQLDRSKLFVSMKDPATPFDCLCSCLNAQEYMYVIVEAGHCYCSKKYEAFGNDTGKVTVNGKCPQPHATIVYSIFKYTQEVVKYCHRPNIGTGLERFLQSKESMGVSHMNFNNAESLATKVNSSSLLGTHLNKTDAEVAKNVNRWHKKEGTIITKWRAMLSKGPLINMFSLRIHLQRLHNLTEFLNLTTKQDVQLTRSSRVQPFRRHFRPMRLVPIRSLGGTFRRLFPRENQER